MSMKPDYTPLDPTKPEIRLLRIHPGSPHYKGDTVRCDLFVADLQDAELQYDALSYCWGDPTPQQTIVVNNQVVEIGPSLELALRHLRNPVRKLIIWADVLCIDQSNVPEKNHQVGQMGLVYRRAKTVHVWLGEGRFENEIPHEQIKQWKHVMDDEGGYTIPGHPRTVNRLLDFSPDSIATIVDIIHSQYWTRTWVLQEMALAAHVAVHYGRHQIPLHELLQWYAALGDIGHNAEFIQMHNHDPCFSDSNPELTAFRDSQALTICMYSTLNLLSYLRSGEPCRDSLIFKIARSLRRNVATDLRDKVYGISGLVLKKPSSTGELLEVDYSKSITAVWIDFARYTVEDGSAFGVLQLSGRVYAGLLDSRMLRTPGDTSPSWVPNLTRMPGEATERDLLEDDKLAVEAVCVDRPSMWVRGKKIDKISARLFLPMMLHRASHLLGSSPHNGASESFSGGFRELFGGFCPGLRLPDGTPRLRCLLRLLKTDSRFDSYIDQRSRALLSFLFNETIKASGLTDKDADAMVRLTQSDLQLDEAEVKDIRELGASTIKSKFEEEARMVALLWRENLQGSFLCMTENGMMGKGSAKIRYGDHVYLLEPDDAVFVLSPQTDHDGREGWYTNAGHCRILDIDTSVRGNRKRKRSIVERPWIETRLSHEKMPRPCNPTNALGLLRPFCLFDYGIGLPAKRREYTDIEIR